jgi:hypothetical protein
METMSTVEPLDKRVLAPPMRKQVSRPPPMPEPPAPTLDASALGAALLALHQARSEEGIADVLFEVVAGQCPAGCLVLMARQGNVLRVVRAQGSPADASTVIQLEGPLGRRLRTGLPLHVADYRGDIIRELGGASMYPARAGGALVATITTDASSGERLHSFWLEALLPHVATALDNVTRHAAAREAVAEAAQPIGGGAAPRAPRSELMGAAHALMHGSTLSSLLRTVLEEAVSITGANKGSIMLLGPDGRELVVRAITGLHDIVMERRIARGEVSTPRISIDHGVAGEVFRTETPMFVDRSDRSDKFAKGEGAGKGSSLATPIRVSGRALGVLNLSTARPSSKLQEAALDVEVLADMAGIAIARTMAYEAVSRDPVTGMLFGTLVRAWLREGAAQARRRGEPMSILAFGVTLSSDVERISQRRLLAVAEALNRVAADHMDLAGNLGKGRFVVGCLGLKRAATVKLAERICSELGTMYQDEAGWSFVVGELSGGESGSALARRAITALKGSITQGTGIRFVMLS